MGRCKYVTTKEEIINSWHMTRTLAVAPHHVCSLDERLHCEGTSEEKKKCPLLKYKG